MNREFWYTLWGVGLAFAIQMIYEGINEYPNLSRGFWSGLVINGFILAILILVRGKKPITNKETKERKKEKENRKDEKIDRDTELPTASIGALLDFYSDRAVAHASFFVASIFGLITLLAVIAQLNNNLKWFSIPLSWWSIPLFLVFSYVGYYTLARFGFHADIAQKFSELVPFNEATLESYIKKQEELQKKLLILKKIITIKRGKDYLALLYWGLIGFLGSIVYSKFGYSQTEWIEWFGFFAIFVTVFVIIPWLYYRKSIRE